MKEKENKILYHWQSLSNLPVKRGKLWYFVTITLDILLIVYALYTVNFLFALLMILINIIIIVKIKESENIIDIALLEDYIIIDNKKISYNNIIEFNINSFEDIYILYISYKSTFFNSNNLIRVYLFDNANPLKIKNIFLNKKVKENLDLEKDNRKEEIHLILKI